MKVSLEAGARLALRVLVLDVALLLEPCAVVPGRPVVAPGSFADPAPLPSALLAGLEGEALAGSKNAGNRSETHHVLSSEKSEKEGRKKISSRTTFLHKTKSPTHVASSVLLDRRVALGALLGVGTDPIGRLAVVRALLHPPLDDRAAARAMVGLAAPEAERVVARALDDGDDDVERARGDGALDRVLAVRCGAPAEVRVVVDVGAVEEGAVAVGASRQSRDSTRERKRGRTERGSPC